MNHRLFPVIKNITRNFSPLISPYNAHLSERTPRNSPLRAKAPAGGAIFVVPERGKKGRAASRKTVASIFIINKLKNKQA